MQENHKTELILFDLDGTLIDTAPDFHTSLNTMLKKYNMNEVSESDIRSHISEGTSKLIKKFFAIDEDDSEFEPLKSEFLTEYNMNKTKGCKLFDGMTSLINFMDKNNIKYGVVTNKFFKFASPIIDSFPELKNIKVIVCPEHVKISKPDPEGILLACKKLDINPLNTIYLGDHIRTRVEVCGNDQFIVKVPNSYKGANLKEGASVKLSWKASDSRALDLS